MKNLQQFLAELENYPDASQIDEASNIAQTKALEYVYSLDNQAVVTVEEGEVYIKSDILDSENMQNAQCIFDEEFSAKIKEL